jgi:pimeloyl-ACP methyl ester carboxylesterase
MLCAIYTDIIHQGLGQQQRDEKDLPGGISNLIYLAAYAIPEGKAMIDGVRHFGHEQLMPLAFDFADDMTCVSRDPKTLLVGENDLPSTQVEDYLASLVRWNGQAMYQPLTTPRAAWRDIPVTYIHTTEDVTVPFDYQKWFVDCMEREGVKVQTATLETGHCANFTATKRLATIIEEVVKGSLQIDKSGVAKGTSKDDVKDAILNVQGKE